MATGLRFHVHPGRIRRKWLTEKQVMAILGGSPFDYREGDMVQFQLRGTVWQNGTSPVMTLADAEARQVNYTGYDGKVVRAPLKDIFTRTGTAGAPIQLMLGLPPGNENPPPIITACAEELGIILAALATVTFAEHAAGAHREKQTA